MFGGILEGLGGGLVSGLFGRQQQKRGFNQNRAMQETQHKFASQEAEKQRDFSAQQVANQMAFQERMASTQHQRSAADLDAAGLNRILALGRPAVAPPGAAAQGAAASGVGGSGGPAGEGPAAGMQAGIALASARQAIQTQEAQEDLLKAQAASTRAKTDRDDIIGDVFQAAKPFTDALGGFTSSAKQGYEQIPKMLEAIKDIITNKYDAFKTNVRSQRNDKDPDWEYRDGAWRKVK